MSMSRMLTTRMFTSLSEKSSALVATTLLCLALAGCTVGPRYHRPSASTPAAPNYKESPANFQDADGWKVASPHDEMLHGNWWEVFQQPELNDLEKQLNIDNQTIKIYFENYLAARATLRETRAQYYPSVSVGAGFNRSRTSGSTGQTFLSTRFRPKSPGRRTCLAGCATP